MGHPNLDYYAPNPPPLPKIRGRGVRGREGSASHPLSRERGTISLMNENYLDPPHVDHTGGGGCRLELLAAEPPKRPIVSLGRHPHGCKASGLVQSAASIDVIKAATRPVGRLGRNHQGAARLRSCPSPGFVDVFTAATSEIIINFI